MNSNNAEATRKKLDTSGDLSAAESYEDFLQNLNKQTEKLRQPKNELDKDDFLKLFITQLQNQDPLKPKDGTEMASQLAQFNGLEQMMNVNKSLERLEQSSKKSQNFNLINTVGKSAFIKTNEIALKTGDATKLEFSLPVKTDTTKIKITDVNGKPIVEKELGVLEEGENTFLWDGKNSKGEPFTDGKYFASITYTDREGASKTLETLAKVNIDGIDLSSEEIMLETKLGKKPISELQAIREVEQKKQKQEDLSQRHSLQSGPTPGVSQKKVNMPQQKSLLPNRNMDATGALPGSMTPPNTPKSKPVDAPFSQNLNAIQQDSTNVPKRTQQQTRANSYQSEVNPARPKPQAQQAKS